ncbi:MAG: S-layer homology domain-containing protein [Oscillospiraceae bacterium]|nr:S-layer homology domain-containing protein [Oscillospiraceae bacterium]
MLQVIDPIANPYSGFVVIGTEISLSTDTEGAIIRYTTNASEPTETSELYTTPIVITSAETTIKTKAFKAGMIESNTKEFTYILSDAPLLYVTGETGKVGEEIEVEIIADNLPLLAALEFKLIYPESVMTLIRADLADDSGFSIIFPVEYPSGTLFACTPLGTDTVDPNGVLINLTFVISPEATPGVYPITFSESYAGDEDGNSIAFISKSGEITIANPIQYGHFTGRDRVDGTDVLWINRYIASGRDLSVMLENFPTTITTFHEAAAYFTNRSRVDGTDVLWINRYIASGRNVEIMLQSFPTTIDFSHLGTINTALNQAKTTLIPNVSISLASDASSMVTLTPSSTVVTIGNTFTVAIGLDCEPGENIAAFEFFLNFDPAVLRLETPYEYPGVLQAADVIGTFFGLTPRASTPHTGSGNIVVLTFTVLDDSKPAIVGINIDYAGDSDGNEIVVSNPDSVTINPQMTDAQSVALDKASLTWESIRGENITQNAVTADLAVLPTTGANGTEITWDSTNPAVTNLGSVTRPIFSEGDAMGTLKAIITKGNDSDSVDFVLTVLKLPDTSPPVGSITIETHSWNSFWDMITFGLFCKETQIVTITGEDDSGEPVDIQYYLSTDELTLNQIEAITDWTDYTNSFNIIPNNKHIIYAKLTDSSDNAAYVNSAGIVLYTDSAQDTASISFTKGSGLDQTANVTLNGNTINGIINGSLILENADDYTVSGETITFKADYLDGLAAGDYTLTVSYNPLGMEYPSDPLSGSQSPATTTIALKINGLVDAEPPDISEHPQGAEYTQNETAAPLMVTAASPDGGTLSYQWYSAPSSSAEGMPVGTNNNTYTPSTATVGTLYYYVVVTNTNTNVNGNTSATTTSDLAVITVNDLPDITLPTGEITIGTQGWNSFSNEISFGLFCTEEQAVTITGEDNSGEPVDIQYYLYTGELTIDQVKAIIGWTDYTNPFNIAPNNQYIIYAKLTDSSENVTYVNSAGIVLYTNSAQDTESISFTKGSWVNQSASIALNGNTFRKIMNGTATLTPGTDYTVSGDTITFTASYLETLAQGDYTLTIDYNPFGVEYPSDPLASSVAPIPTTIALTVKAAPIKTVTVGPQIGVLTEGTAGSAEFTVSTTNIATGSSIELIGAPSGITLETITTTGDSTVITVSTTAMVMANIYSLTITIDGTTSNSFDLYVTTPSSISVTSIEVTGAGGATAITTNGGTLQMLAVVVPSAATNPAVTWSVINGTGSATISASGLLLATGNGTVVVKAAANDGSRVYGELEILISGQPEEPEEPEVFTITFNPNGGSVSPINATTGADGKLSSLPTPTRNGNYSFDGWFTAISGGTQVTTSYVFTADTTIYAQWTSTTGSSGSNVTGIQPTPTPTPIPDEDIQDNETPLDWFNPYTDVVDTDWFNEAVQFVTDKQLMNGTDEDKFSPGVAMSRAMLVTVLYRLEGSPEVSGDISFSDVYSGQWYSNAILWASQNDIVKGYSSDTFGLDDPVTREQAVSILYRYAEAKGLDVSASVDLSEYSDMDNISDWALDAMQWSVAVGIIQGHTSTTIAPQGTSTRAEVAMIFKRYIEAFIGEEYTSEE